MAKQTGSLDLRAAKQAHDQAKAEAEKTSQYFWHNTQDSGAGEGAGAHITEVPQEDFIDDPANGGGNLLARSNGMVVRDGLTELAVFGAKGMEVYGQYGSVAFIGLSDTQALAYIPTDTGIPAVGVAAEIDFGEAIDWALGEVKVEVVAYIDPFTVYKKSVSFTAYGRKTIAINGISCSWNVQLVNGSNGAEVYITTTQLGVPLTAMSYIRAYHWGTANAPIFYTGTPAEAGGAYSATLGLLCSAEGYGAHATNMGTKATSDFQTALGKYNVVDSNDVYGLILGNGTADNARSNAFAVKWTGDVEAAGDIEDGSGNVLSDKADTSAIPTKTSDLTNDSGFISSESDPVFSASAAAGISNSDITSWNNKSDFSGSYTDLTNKPTIPTKTSDLTNDRGFITSAFITTDDFSADNISIASGGTTATGYTDGNISVAKTGYTPVAVVGFEVVNATSSGSNGASVFPSQLYVNGNNVHYRLQNRRTAAAKVKLNIWVLYTAS